MLADDDLELQLKDVVPVAEYLGLNEYVIEKDLYVTQAILVVSQIRHELYDIVFQGGTSLVKAHRVLERMSEDCDFRVCYKESAIKCSRTLRRNALRELRHQLLKALRVEGFVINDDDVRVRNEGRFMGIRANYPSIFTHIDSMKPFVALDFFCK